MSETSETKGGLRRGRRAAFVAAIAVALTVTAPWAGAARDGAGVESNAAAFRSSAGVAPAPVVSAVLAPPITVPTTEAVLGSAGRSTASTATTAPIATAAAPRVEVAPSLVNDVVGLLGRTLASLLNGLAGAVRTSPASPPASSPSTSTSTTATSSTSSTSTTVAATTSSTLACRNSTDSACGPFRFDPQPAPDRPMTVQVTAQPSTVAVGQPMVFRLTLVDPDGVSHGASSFFFGDAGQGASSIVACTKYGPWDPPAPDPSRSTEVREVAHTYSEAGTFTAIFGFRADPFDCVDSVTGRGDRPYASSATGSVTIGVTP